LHGWKDNNPVPGHKDGAGQRSEGGALELQGHRPAAIHQHIEPVNAKKAEKVGIRNMKLNTKLEQKLLANMQINILMNLKAVVNLQTPPSNAKVEPLR